MKFLDKDSNNEIDLNIIVGSSFWKSHGEEIYVVDEKLGKCWPISPAMALETVLRREMISDHLCTKCHEMLSQANPRPLKREVNRFWEVEEWKNESSPREYMKKYVDKE